MNRESVTARQIFFLLFLFLLGNLVTGNEVRSLQNGWLIYLLMGLLTIPVYVLYMKVSQQRCAGAIFVSSLGPKVGGALTVVYCLLAVSMAGDAIRQFADFIAINDLNDAGAWGNALLLTLVIFFLLACNLRSLGKTAWGIFPLTAAFLLLSLGLTITKMDLRRLLPILQESNDLLIRGGIGGAVSELVPAFFPIAALGGSAPKKWEKSVLWAGVSACLMLSLLNLRITAVLGAAMMEMFRFPSFAAANAMQHSEILISSAFVFSQPFRAALCLRYVQECLIYWKPRWKQWYAPVLVLLSVANASLSWNTQHRRWRTSGGAVVVILLLVGPAAAVIVDLVKKKRRAKAANITSPSDA